MDNSEDLFAKFDKRDKLIKGLELLVVLGLVVVTLLSLYQLREYIAEGRLQNKQRQDNIVNHLDCVFLLTKKYPNINFQSLNYEQAKNYLTECAKVD